MLNFNVDPYFDDFDPNNNYHRILFRPGRAVQARELTQSQTILQDQITKFADHIFKQNTPVTGGQVTVNTNAIYLKLNTTYNDNDIVASDFLNQVIVDATGTIFAKVIATEEATSVDAPTLIVTYLSGNQFSAGDLVYSSSTSSIAQIVATNFTGLATTASISEGVFYIVNGYSFSDVQNDDGTYSRYSIGNFVSVQPQTIIVQKFGNTPTKRIGLSISEFVSDYVTDPNLLDPAVGATNYQAPGADRYTITLTLDTKDITTGADSNFIELTRITGGVIQRLVDGTVYGVINDYFAKRTYDTNGDFIVNDFKITPTANTENSTTYKLNIGAGVAYVKGYRVESSLDSTLETSRARETELINNNNMTLDYGNYLYVNDVTGVLDVTKVIQVDFHAANTNTSIDITNATTYNSTKAGSAYLRGLEFESASDNANTRTYIYKAYISDIKANTLTAAAVSGTSTTIEFNNTGSKFSAVDNAYINATISIDSGTSAGDVRKIISYNGTTKTATVDSPFTIIPTSSSNFSLRFDVANFNLLTVPPSSGISVATFAGVDPLSKTDGIVSGVSTLPTVIGNPTSPELIFNIGYPYVYNLNDETYQSWKMSRGVSFASGVATFSLSGTDATFVGSASATQSSTEAKDNWVVIVTDKGSSSFNNGQIINFTSTNTIALDVSKKIATLTAGGSTFTGTILARSAITDAGTTAIALKIKNLIQANTTGVNITGTNVGGIKVDLTHGQVYIPSLNQVRPGSSQSLYIADVKNIVKIIDTGAPSIVAIDAMLSNLAYDVTQNFILDNGQTDSYYGHASISLKRGAPTPKGNLLVLVNYYQHAGGDGYFSINSYLGAGDGGVSSNPENYAEIGTYTAKTSGITYNLRDCIDYRLSAVNAQAALEFRYSTSVTSTGGALLPVDSSTFITDYSHYLGRKDLLILTTDNKFKLIRGKAENRPVFPTQPEGSLLLAKLSLDPYTAYLPGQSTNYLPNISIEKVQHKRWRMQDISDLQTRVNNIEYYTSLSLLEKQASDLQVPDANGLNRFKNGILVDNFTGFSVTDISNEDYYAKINKRLTTMTAPERVLNAPLFNLNALNAYGNLSAAAEAGLSYKYHSKTGGASSVITLPYTTANLVSQKLASVAVSLNPFAVVVEDGVLNINPAMDMWIDNERQPDILIVDPTTTLWRQGNTLNTLEVTDWVGTTGTEYSVTRQSGRQVTTTTYEDQQRQTVTGNYDKVSSVSGNFITDVSVQPYIRGQNLILRAEGMKINTPVSVYFDGTKVDEYIIYPNVIELSEVYGTFEAGDVVGFVSSGTFVPTARVISVTKLSSTSVRLYVSSDNKSQSAYSPTNQLISGKFSTSGVYTGTPNANGIYSSASSAQISLSGQVAAATAGSSSTLPGGATYKTGTNLVTLSSMASSVDDYYNGSTIRITTVNQRQVTKTGYRADTVWDFDWDGNWFTRVIQTPFDFIEFQTFNETFTATISDYVGSTKVATLSNVVNVSLGNNKATPGGQATAANSTYSIVGTQFLMTQATSSQKVPKLSTDEYGNFTALLQLPGGTFKTGDKTIRIDNRATDTTPATATTFAQGVFTASSLATKSTSLNFGGTIQAAAKNNVFTATQERLNQVINTVTFTVDPIAQTFIIDQATYPNGAFISSIKVYFRTKPTGTSAVPVKLYITDTLNGYPNGQILDGSLVTKTAQQINVSLNPQYLDSSTYTEFTFDAPVYIRAGNLYAFILQTTSADYTVWTAAQNSIAVASSVKNLPTDSTPTVITKIGGSPYIGALFESQNGITWTADQTKNLMFIIDNCVFNTAATPTVQYVVPKKIPLRKKVSNDLEYISNANTASNINGTLYAEDFKVDAFNITTTDFSPTDTELSYTYRPSLYSSYAADTTRNVQPGKFGTAMPDNIYLDDGKGSRVLDANSSSSFVVTATLSSDDKYVSPVLSDDGLSVYSIQYSINNMSLANTDVLVTSGNTAGVTAIYTLDGDGKANVSATISAPTSIGGQQANAIANLVTNGVGGYIVDKIIFDIPGSGYITTPTITIAANGTGSLATAIVKGETSSSGGNGIAKYITKKVVLTPGNDSGDLRVYYTAYKPVGSSILVYYKIQNRNDTEKFEDQTWKIMTETEGSNSFSLSRDDLREFVSSPGTNNIPDNKISYTSTSGLTYNQFSQFAIKIVLATSDSTRTPVLHDLRVLALPSGA
jgi:hypothetical protein